MDMLSLIPRFGHGNWTVRDWVVRPAQYVLEIRFPRAKVDLSRFIFSNILFEELGHRLELLNVAIYV